MAHYFVPHLFSGSLPTVGILAHKYPKKIPREIQPCDAFSTITSAGFGNLGRQKLWKDRGLVISRRQWRYIEVVGRWNNISTKEQDLPMAHRIKPYLFLPIDSKYAGFGRKGPKKIPREFVPSRISSGSWDRN